MPVDRYHAFASGPTWPLTTAARRSWLARAWRALGRRLAQIAVQEPAQQAAESFRHGALFGSGCRTGPNAWCANLGQRGSIRLGEGVICRGILRCESWRDARLVVGDHVYIGDDCIISCAERIEIGRLTLLAHGVQIFDNDSHPLDPVLREKDYMIVRREQPGPRPTIASAPVLIGERAWIGFNAVVIKGVQIGDGSVVAAGSVVTENVPPYTLVAGNPARIVKQVAVCS